MRTGFQWATTGSSPGNLCFIQSTDSFKSPSQLPAGKRTQIALARNRFPRNHFSSLGCPEHSKYHRPIPLHSSPMNVLYCQLETVLLRSGSWFYHCYQTRAVGFQNTMPCEILRGGRNLRVLCDCVHLSVWRRGWMSFFFGRQFFTIVTIPTAGNIRAWREIGSGTGRNKLRI